MSVQFRALRHYSMIYNTNKYYTLIEQITLVSFKYMHCFRRTKGYTRQRDTRGKGIHEAKGYTRQRDTRDKGIYETRGYTRQIRYVEVTILVYVR